MSGEFIRTLVAVVHEKKIAKVFRKRNVLIPRSGLTHESLIFPNYVILTNWKWNLYKLSVKSWNNLYKVKLYKIDFKKQFDFQRLWNASVSLRNTVWREVESNRAGDSLRCNWKGKVTYVESASRIIVEIDVIDLVRLVVVPGDDNVA